MRVDRLFGYNGSRDLANDVGASKRRSEDNPVDEINKLRKSLGIDPFRPKIELVNETPRAQAASRR